MVDSKHQWKAWLYLLPAIILLIVFTVWPIINTVTTAFIYKVEYKPASIQVESVGEDGYRFFYAGEEGEKRYMNAVVNSEEGSVHLNYADNAGANSVFKFDSDLDAWTITVSDKKYFIGATENTDVDLIEATEANVGKIGTEFYPAGLFSSVANKYITSDFDPKAGYTFGVFKGLPEALKYVLATAEDGVLNTTDSLNSSAALWAENSTVGEKRGYKLYLADEDYCPTHYLNAVVGEDGSAYMEYADANESAGTAFAYDETNNAWICVVDEVEYYIGLDATDSISVFPIVDISSENAPSPVAMYMHRREASEAKVMTQLMQDFDYRIGAHRAANGKQTYITTGNSLTNGLMLTEDIINGESFTKFGINNFTHVLTSKGSDFMVCLKNTLILTIITVPISTILAILIAVALNSIKPLQRLLQTIFFLPYVTNSIAIGMVFAAMFNIVGINSTHESVGIINNILGLFGIERINWINAGAESWASFTALIVYIIWNALPFKILILLGGLQSINKQYYDAAKIDSTPKWRVLTKITVPLLSPMITYTVITSFIGGFKEYSSVVGIFGEAKAVAGGANMNTIVGHIQNHLTITHDYGLAGAAALMLFVIIFIVTMINLRISKKNTHY